MSLLEGIVAIAEAIAWPSTILVLVYLLRNQAQSLITMVHQLRYKEFSLSFRNDTENTLKSLELNQEIDSTLTESIKQISDPKMAVLKAWKRLEQAAFLKISELDPNRASAGFGPNGPLGYIEYLGALTPRSKQTISELGSLRDQATHLPSSAVPVEGARDYQQAAAVIQKQIEALSALPAIKLSRLTLLILEYNHLVDTGRFQHITIDDVHREIERGTILRFVRDIAGSDADFSMYFGGREASEFEAQYVGHLQAIYGGSAGQERRKWGVEHHGLCLLIAWTNEIIQTGSGWQPNEDLIE